MTTFETIQTNSADVQFAEKACRSAGEAGIHLIVNPYYDLESGQDLFSAVAISAEQYQLMLSVIATREVVDDGETRLPGQILARQPSYTNGHQTRREAIEAATARRHALEAEEQAARRVFDGNPLPR